MTFLLMAGRSGKLSECTLEWVANITFLPISALILITLIISLKVMWKQILVYLYIKKKDPNAPKSIDLKFMHGMNRISILMFLVAIIVMIVRLIMK